MTTDLTLLSECINAITVKYGAPFKYKGRLWHTLNSAGGIDKKIMNKIFQQLEKMLALYARVTTIFFDLKPKHYTYNNQWISDFFNQLKYRLKKEYGCEVGYIWVREQDMSNKQHYHCAVFLDKDKARFPHTTLMLGQEIWKRICQGAFIRKKRCVYHTVRFTSDNGMSMQRVILRLSYLAKKHSKSIPSSEVKGHSTARLPNPH